MGLNVKEKLYVFITYALCQHIQMNHRLIDYFATKSKMDVVCLNKLINAKILINAWLIMLITNCLLVNSPPVAVQVSFKVDPSL